MSNEIKKYIKKIDFTNFFITDNILDLIENRENLEFLKENILLLSINNFNNKYGLLILLENRKFQIIEELIENNYYILGFKNLTNNNFLKELLNYEYFYEYINKILNKIELSFLIKILNEINNFKFNFIDKTIFTLKLNLQNKNIIKILNIIKSIYNLDKEDDLLLINKLCDKIDDSKSLLKILKFIDIKNFDIEYDNNFLTCIDYLVLNKNLLCLKYILDKIDYIYFANIDNSCIFSLLDELKINNDKKIKKELFEIIFEILKKSNLKKIKNIYNQNIIFKILENYKINVNSIKNLIKKINIYDEDNFGNSIYNLLINNYDIKNLDIDFKNINKNNYNKIINFKKILKNDDYGIYGNNFIHNLLYTNIFIDKYRNLKIPFIPFNKEYIIEKRKLFEISNNKEFTEYAQLYLNYSIYLLPSLVYWKNSDDYFIDINLIEWIKKNNKSYIFLKLSIKGEDKFNRHANILFIDYKNNILERFEPYGDNYFCNSLDLNFILKTEIADKLNLKFKFVQSYPGFQTKSHEFDSNNIQICDPNGFCLAWCFLYIEIKMILINKNKNYNPIDVIDNYIINNFKKDFKNINNDNLYMVFIRYYARHLDLEKNKVLKSFGINNKDMYKKYYNYNEMKIISDNINNKLLKILI